VETLLITGAVFSVIGAAFVAIGIAVTRSIRGFERRAARASGRVVDVRWEAVGPSGNKIMTGFPVLSFTLPDGRAVETVANTGTTFDVMKEGQAVAVLYDPDDPTQARVDSRASSAGSTLVGAAFMVIGGVFVVLGLALLVAGAVISS
jgi:Protein of unknown function (DUF3592)